MSYLTRFAASTLLSLMALSLTACGGGGGGGTGETCANPVTSVSITPTTGSLSVGGTLQFTGTPKNATGQTIAGLSVTWASSSTAFVTIDNTGLATGRAIGSTTIFASEPGINCNGVTTSTVFSNRVFISVVPFSSVSGTAATGAAIGGATLTLKDRSGDSRNAVTDAAGHYSIDTSGLTPPFLLQVLPSGRGYGRALYSASTDTSAHSTVNVDPLTDLIVQSWYRLQGVSAAAAFADPVSNPPPSPASARAIDRLLAVLLRPELATAGMPDMGFSLISTPFAADGTGMDALLDRTHVDTSAGSITIGEGAALRSIQLGYDVGAHAISAASDGVSSETVIPVTDPE